MFILPRIVEQIRKLQFVNGFEKATEQPLRAQQDILLDIIWRNARTEFGKEHGFLSISNIDDFRHRVPIHRYEQLRKHINSHAQGKSNVLVDEDIVLFATTSGTTGKPKYIPVTGSFIDKYREGWHIWLYFLYRDHPAIFSGKILTIVSPKEEGMLGKVPYGSISGLIHDMQPQMVKQHYALPACVYRIKDHAAKYYAIARLAAEQDISLFVTPNPSMVLMICKKINEFREKIIKDVREGVINGSFFIEKEIKEQLLARLRPNKRRADELEQLARKHHGLYPRHIWKNLAAVGCWKGGPLMMYLHEFPTYFGDVPVRDIGLMATEGRSSIPMQNKGSGGVLSITTTFIEFVRENDKDLTHPEVLLCSDVKKGENYYIVLTNHAGLYRYWINDIVKVTGSYHKTPVIEFVRKGEHMTNITGEKVTEWQVVHAAEKASKKLNLPVYKFTATVEFGDPPHYAVVAEMPKQVAREVKEQYIRCLDRNLALLNLEYMAKRLSRRLGPMELDVVEEGAYESLVRSGHLSSHDAQAKIPYLTPDTRFLQEFSIVERIAGAGVAAVLLVAIGLNALSEGSMTGFFQGSVTGAAVADGAPGNIVIAIITLAAIIFGYRGLKYYYRKNHYGKK